VLPDGTIKHIRTIRHPVLNDAGDLVKLVGITIDITERKRTEEALRLSNAYNRSLIEASLDPLVTIGPDGKITDVNGATEAATGRSRGELIGTDFSDYFTEPAQARAGYEQVFREGTVRDYPLELRHRSGRVMSVLYNASVYRDESGQVIGIFAAARDITERKQAEEQAMHLATIVESSEDAVLSKTLEGVIVSWNRGAQKIYGYTAEEAVGKSISILADPGGPDETPELLRRVGQGESLDHYETVRRRKDGKLITVSLTLSPIQDASGQIIGASTIARDITERKRAAEALRLSNAYNRSLIEASLDPLVTIGSDGKITDVNGATEAATGCSRGELIGTDFCDYFTEPAQARAGYEQVFREGVVRDYPLDLRHRSGRVMSVLYNASVYRDESGRVIGVFAAARDLTERKRAEDAARRSRAYLAEAQSLSHTGSFGWNVATGEILFSDETFRHFEYDASTKVTIPLILERTHPDDIPLMQQVLARAANDGKDFDFEHRLLMPNGSVKHVHVVAHAVKDKSGNVEFIGAVMDMTAAKQAEEALQEARAELARVTRVTMMGELAASIAHEVNQPLAGVVTSANAGLNWLAKDPPNLLKTREAIERILRDGTRAGEVLTRIRTLLKRTSPTKSSVSVNQIVRDVVALTGGELRQKNIELSVELNPSLPAIMGDSIQLQQVLLNLIMNAIEAMSGITNRRKILRVQSELGELDGKPAVSLKVSDTGIGFSTTDTGRLFEAFHTTKPEGLGMGLWISRSIIEGHGGRLTAQSNDGPGATFQILLPSKTGDSNE
jgi:PAS domain S-box-containing protein